MLIETPRRVNLGSGELPLAGYLNIDQHSRQADVTADFRTGVHFCDLDEVRMDHALEHIPWADVQPLLERIRSWLKPGGKIRVEVPDMETIMRWPPPEWVQWVYGCQAHDGEFHRCGFTPMNLRKALEAAGFKDVRVETFITVHPMRTGMPCVIGEGHA